jgi:hypothetical protein
MMVGLRHSSTVLASGILIGLTSCSGSHSTRHVTTLTAVSDPYHYMHVDGTRLFLTDGEGPDGINAEIQVRSLADGSLLRSFGEEGEGTGQFAVQPGHSVHLSLLPDRIVANSSGKVTLLSKEGRLEKELLHPGNLYWFLPFGGGFVAREQRIARGKTTVYVLNRYDEELNRIAPICEKDHTGKAFTGDILLQVHNEELYVGMLTDELEVFVFDTLGNQVRSIQVPYERPPVSAAHREENHTRLLNRPGWENFFGDRTAYREFLDSTITYPDRFPAIMAMHLADERIYVVTFRQQDGTREVIMLTLDGQDAARLQVPFRMRSLLQFYPYAIGNRHLYQIVPSDSPGEWDLFATRLW